MTTHAAPAELELRLPAIELKQPGGQPIYAFAVEGKRLPEFTTISRIRRDGVAAIHGYQRPEVASHIRQIRQYLETDDAVLPNALVVAFDDRVTFEPRDDDNNDPSAGRSGHLRIPLGATDELGSMPGWIVDGQQRAAAIREAEFTSFPIFVTAFIANDVEQQRSQFILVNSTKPLPKGLIYELLPVTSGVLPDLLRKKQLPAAILHRLNHDEDSALRHMIRTPTNSDGVIKDNSVLRMLQNSLSDGALYVFRDPMTGSTDLEGMLTMVKRFWAAAQSVFPEAWGLSPRKSRLMHGVGIVSMGFLMDAMAERHSSKGIPNQEAFRADLEELQQACRWTHGYWDFGKNAQRKWNDFQNTSRDIQLIANYLLSEYKHRVWRKEPA